MVLLSKSLEINKYNKREGDYMLKALEKFISGHPEKAQSLLQWRNVLSKLQKTVVDSPHPDDLSLL